MFTLIYMKNIFMFYLILLLLFDKIIPYDEFWCRGRINGRDGYVPKSYITEKPHALVEKNFLAFYL